MLDKEKYGVVYTPEKLSEFVSQLVIDEFEDSIKEETVILDPACGECSLLDAINKRVAGKIRCIGIDIDEHTIKKDREKFGEEINLISSDFILPRTQKPATTYWKDTVKEVSVIIANPPWSMERMYDKEQLKKAGYKLIDGQYDNYILFIEACIELVQENGICAFIIPDSLFSGENKKIRKMLCENVSIKVIARLGEKLFEGVNRATTVIVIKKEKPKKESLTKCFRLNTEERRRCLEGKTLFYDCYKNSVHTVKQKRFSESKEYLFDVDLMEEEEQLIRKIEEHKIEWNKLFQFKRGVEISKTGEVVVCSQCGIAQGFSKKQFNSGEKQCRHCGEKIVFDASDVRSIIFEKEDVGLKKIYVGENLHRYSIDGCRYIKLDVPGIDYKNPTIYIPPKILVRKTGLGINAYLDNDSTFITQTIYSCQYISQDNVVPMEYYLALLNSRVVYYYYIKTYGENEWKSHPYFTKDILFSLPVKKYEENDLTMDIIRLTKKILKHYSRELDLFLEEKIMDWYGLSESERSKIKKEMNRLPNLHAINNMKF